MTRPQGFVNPIGYMGRIDGKWQQFATEEEYKEALEESRQPSVRIKIDSTIDKEIETYERKMLCICGRELQSED